ncbi:MAG: alpha/beta hydrolase [Leptospiraceae bacterium]|nr:alpha/beta hydrolase [Leptospiraceae bacterium]
MDLEEIMVDIGDQEICYHVSKSGNKPLVYIHGLLDASFGFRKILPHLSNEWKVYLVDVPSFGKSKLPPLKVLFQIPIFAEMIYNSIKKLGLKDVTLVGHSMGGLIGQHLCLVDKNSEFQRISKLILLSPGNEPHEKRDEVRELLFPENEEEVNHLLHSLYYARIPEPSEFLKKTLVYGWNSKEYHYLAENTIEKEHEVFFGKKAGEIKIPTLILAGENDEIVPLKSLKNLKKWIKGSKLSIIHHTRHAIHLEAPVKIAHEINDFGI